MTASSADLRCLFIKKQTNKTNAYIKPATEIDQHPSYPKVNNHINALLQRRRRILRLTSRCSLRVRLYTSSNPTLSLCDSNAINYESTVSKAFKLTQPTPSSTNPQQQTSIQVIETVPTDKTTPPKEKPTATSNQPPKH